MGSFKRFEAYHNRHRTSRFEFSQSFRDGPFVKSNRENTNPSFDCIASQRDGVQSAQFAAKILPSIFFCLIEAQQKDKAGGTQ